MARVCNYRWPPNPLRRRGLIIAVTALLCLAFSTPAGAQTVYLVNQSTLISDAELATMLVALQAQVTEDFEPVWNLDATLVLNNKPPPGAWRITVNDVSDAIDAIGYHDVCHDNGVGGGYPCGYASVQTARDNEYEPSMVISHELLELLADPYTSTFVKVGRRFYIQEVCDAPESDAYAYTRPGSDGTQVTLSDFVTPFFFRPGHAGPYDFRGQIERPLQILSGGYLSWWQDGHWNQDFNWIRGRE